MHLCAHLMWAHSVTKGEKEGTPQVITSYESDQMPRYLYTHIEMVTSLMSITPSFV
jgi:hypothetical protein